MKTFKTTIVLVITFSLGFISGVGYLGNINYYNILKEMDQRDKLSDIKDQSPQVLATEPTTQE